MVYILRVRNLVMEYAVREGMLRAVNGVSLDVPEGKITALVGESGCGKSSLLDAILRTLPPNGYIRSGEVFFRDINLLKLSEKELRKIRWEKIAVVFQAAQNSFNPVLKIADHIVETYQAHRNDLSKEAIIEKACKLLETVRLDPNQVLDAYPHELSGGMKQRALIALSLILDPELLILDEPTSALDTYTQSVIIDMLKKVHEEKKLTMFLVTHDLPVVAELADYVAVMYGGKIMEVADVETIFYNAKHPYTQLLIKAIPSLIGDLSDRKPIPGNPPSLLNPPSGCVFHPRCPFRKPICDKKVPPFFRVGNNIVACWLYGEE